MNTVPRRKALAGLGLLLALLAVATVGGSPKTAEKAPERGAAVAPTSATPLPTASVAAAEPDDTAIPLKRLNRPAATAEAQDLFRAKSWYVAPPPPPPPPPAKPVPPPPPTAPPLPFTFLGKFQESPERLVVFLVRSDRVYTVSEGDVIDGIYRVEGIVAGQLGLTYLPLNIKQTLSVGES